MKKLLLSVVFAMVALTTTFAAQLNPFAYNLYVTEENGQPKLHFFLNADADRVRVILSDGEQDYVLRDYPTSQSELPYVPYNADGYATVITEEDVIRLNLPVGEDLTWRIEVNGTTLSAPELTSQEIPFFCPHALAIDNNPESPYFGRVLVAEARHNVTVSGDYVSKENGKTKAGIYAFRPELLENDNQNKPVAWFDPDRENKKQVYTGNKDFTRQISFSENNSGYQPWMVRISEDGRIFVSSADARQDGCVVWELNPDNLNEWSELIKGDLTAYTGQSDVTDGVYHVKDAKGNFLAGVNCSMDVKGSGEDLKLLLYSVDRHGMLSFVVSNFQLHEYAIGTAKKFTGTPQRINHFGETRYAHVSSSAKVFYDGDNGFWFGGCNSGGSGDIVFAHARKNGNDYIRKSWGDNEDTYYGGSGVKTHRLHTNEEILFKGVSGRKLLFYSVSRESNGEPKLTTKSWGIELSTTKNSRCNDFVVDYADNLYVVDNNNEKLMTVALPYSGIVSTPAPSNEKVKIGCKEGMYTVSLVCNEAIGSVAGAGTYQGCIDQATVTATPKTSDYRFTQWSNGVTANPYTFTVTGNVALTAEFEQINPIPCVVAYNLMCQPNHAKQTFTFSFYANTKPTLGAIVFYNETQTEIGRFDITQDLIKGENSVEVPIVDIPCSGSGSDILWEVELTAPDNAMIGEIYNEGDKGHNLLHMTIDDNPHSDFFGRVYMENSIARNANPRGYFYIYDYAYNLVEKIETGQKGNTLGYYGRPAVGKDGWVYWTDLDYTNGGIFTMNPYTLETSPFFAYTVRNTTTGVLKNGSTVVGSSYSTCDIYGDGKDTKLYAINHNAEKPLLQDGLAIYNIGQSDGTIKHAGWGDAPSTTMAIKNAGNYFFSVVSSSHGVWLACHRTKATNDYVVLQFYDQNGSQVYKSSPEVLKGCRGAGLAVSKDETQLAVAALNKVDDNSECLYIKVFDISWLNSQPTLTLKHEYRTQYKVIPSMHFDYAGNLLVTAGISQTGYNIGSQKDPANQADNKHRLVTYTLPKSPNKITVPARYSQRIPGLIVDEREEVKPITEEATYKTAMVNRPLVAGMYNTLCLPFNLASLTGTPYENAKVLKFTGTSTEEDNTLLLHFQEVSSIEAGVPYLIQTNVELGNEVIFNNVFCPIISDKNPSGGISHTPENCNVTFHAVMNPMVLADYANAWFLVANNRLAVPTVSGEIYGLRGYFTFNGPQNMPEKASITVAKPTPTGDQYQVVNIPVITPSVQKIMYDGQIYILRDNEVYTITGTRVK